MAHYSKLFEKVPVEVQNVSGFDLSHENLFSAKCGTLTPAFVYDCIPNTHLSLSVSSQIQLPPMATDFYGKIDGVFEAFFVPYRLLYGGWQELITHPTNNSVYPSGSLDDVKAKILPNFYMSASFYGAATLSDYLGMKITNSTNTVQVNNPLRYVAYHLIWDNWYRNSFIQRSAFTRTNSSNNNLDSISTLPYKSYGGDSSVSLSTTLADGVDIASLRQRNWAKDYFTSSTPLPQAGTQASMQSSVTVPGGATLNTVNFTWSQLSAMNSLQRWMQRNNIAGYRYSDQILARFGCLPPDSIMDRPIYLGRTIVPVYTKSVYQQGSNNVETTNPFSSIGTKFGSSMGVGNGELISKFHAREHGIFMVLFSLVPRAYYSTGTSRIFFQNKMSDFPDPDFANLGDQPIYRAELANEYVTGDTTFGYQSKDSHYKYIDDQVHGLLRDGSSLSSFALQRSFDIYPELSSDFLKIPQDFLDQVTAVGDSVSNYGCWVDSYFNCKVSMPLPAASIPTLTDPKDVHTIVVSKGGRTL